MTKTLINLLLIPLLIASCNNSEGTETQSGGQDAKKNEQKSASFTEGKDYFVYERVRILDRVAFTEPQEAYSLLLPKGWKADGQVIWNQPGSACAGTYKEIKAQSADGKMKLTMLPDVLYTWNTNPDMMAFNQQASGPNCETREPADAENYLRKIFAAELGNPEIVKIEGNPAVIRTLEEGNRKAEMEMQSYGAGQMRFYPGAVNATLRWPDGREGQVVLGVNIMETVVPDVYTGGSGSFYTTSISNRTVFTYPAAQADEAKGMFATIMAGFRTNPAWNDAVNRFWKNFREQRHVDHLGTLRMMDERTRQIGEQAIRQGQQRLNEMDKQAQAQQARSWEQKQQSSDRMHTDFIKTIREVENYQDATGTYEMSSHYDHAWSRGDGSTFLISNNPNFDPSSVFQDQRWEEMKRVR